MSAVGDSLDALLGSWGIHADGPAAEAVAAVRRECAAVGVSVVDVSTRWGRATVVASVADAAKLRWHADRLSLVANGASGGTVTEVRVVADRHLSRRARNDDEGEQ